MKSAKKIHVLIFIFLSLLQGIESMNAASSIADKGLFSIQFSWNRDSYSRGISVQVEYKKKGFLAKKKASGKTAFHAIKNQFIDLELSEGEYEFISVRLSGGEIGYNKYLKIPLDGTFTVRAGQVTNGGLIYLIRENKSSNNVMALRIDNTEDVKRYITIYKPDFAPTIEGIQPAWKFLKNEQVDKLVNSFAKLIVARESAKLDPKMTHLYATLGTVIQMEKDRQGKVLNYKLIPTPTYQQIKKMVMKKDHTMICTLENGSFLYGTEKGLEYMPLPKGLEKIPKIQRYPNFFNITPKSS